MVNGEHVTDSLPDYALGMLDFEEKQSIDSHLSTCRQCGEDLQEYLALLDTFPLAMVEHEPTPGLKDKIMARAVSDQTDRQGRQSWLARFLPAVQKTAPAWGLASLALVVVLLFSNLMLLQRVNQLENSNPTALRVVPLLGTDAAPQASGLVLFTPGGKNGSITVDRLPRLDENHQYQLWLTRDGERISGGVFSVNKDGYGGMFLWTKEPLDSYSAFGITIEPTGGSPGPTGDKVLGGNL